MGLWDFKIDNFADYFASLLMEADHRRKRPFSCAFKTNTNSYLQVIAKNKPLQKGNLIKKTKLMNNLLRGLIAGYGAKKLGGGCFGTIIVFIIIWMALGNC